MEVRSRRYGGRTMFDTAANQRPDNYNTTTSRASFLKPAAQDKPVWRGRSTSCVFDNSSAKLKVAKTSTRCASGYQSNRQEWDGTTWKTERNLHTDMFRTSYRNGFNTTKPFHKAELKVTTGRMKKREQVFDVSDK